MKINVNPNFNSSVNSDEKRITKLIPIGRFKKSILNSLLALSSLLLFAPLAMAGDFDKGTQLYNARDYSGAAQAFRRVLKANPTNWQAHYYLGHVNMAQGSFAAARKEYEDCLKFSTDGSVKGQCLTSIERCKAALQSGATAGAPASPSSSSPSRVQSSSASSAKSSSPSTSGNPVSPTALVNDANVQQMRAHINQEAQAAVARIRAEAKEQIRHEKEKSNEQYRYKDGSTGYDISDEREQEILKEAEDQCAKVMKDAEHRLKFLK